MSQDFIGKFMQETGTWTNDDLLHYGMYWLYY